MARIKTDPSINFFKHVHKTDDCWLWAGCEHPSGYGKFRLNMQHLPAHRASYILHYGEFDRGLLVCHKCDTPLCVNPDHLFLGTQKDNMQDMINKGRKIKPIGEDMPNAKLTNRKVMQIKQMIQMNFRQKDIADIFTIDPSTISRIKSGLRWRLPL